MDWVRNQKQLVQSLGVTGWVNEKYKIRESGLQLERMNERFCYKILDKPYLQHYTKVLYTKDLIVDGPSWECYSFREGKLEHRPLNQPKISQNVSNSKSPLRSDTDLSIGLLCRQGTTSIDITVLLKSLQKHHVSGVTPPLRVHEIFPYINHVYNLLPFPPSMMTIKMQYFDEDDETQTVIFSEDDVLFA